MSNVLDFEKPIIELEGKIAELRHISGTGEMDIAEEINNLEKRLEKLTSQTYGKLSPWDKTLIARHVNRPHTSDYIKELIDDFTPLSGDRLFGDDAAIIGGIGRFKGLSVVVIGHEKGSSTESRVHHNFGMAKPEGYRKAQRLMRLAESFKLPLLSFVDTAGAWPGIDAESRGQAEAIAKAIDTCLSIKTPFISTIIGEGGSGGAIAIASANKIFMLEHSIYSVISPEGCASILWRNGKMAKNAANSLCMTAQNLLELNVIDDIIPEDPGGAHRHSEKTIQRIGDTLHEALLELKQLSPEELVQHRRQKFLKMGQLQP